MSPFPLLALALLFAGCLRAPHPEPARLVQAATANEPQAECCAESHDGQCAFSSSTGCPVGPMAPRKRRAL
jgi:hypothetical protein